MPAHSPDFSGIHANGVCSSEGIPDVFTVIEQVADSPHQLLQSVDARHRFGRMARERKDAEAMGQVVAQAYHCSPTVASAYQLGVAGRRDTAIAVYHDGSATDDRRLSCFRSEIGAIGNQQPLADAVADPPRRRFAAIE